MKLPCALVVASCLAVVAQSQQAAQPRAVPPDSIVGLWLGTAGLPSNQIRIGFDIRQTPTGELRVWVTQPVINFYGYEIPGLLVRDSVGYKHDGMTLNLRFKNEMLEGEWMGLNAPLALRRTKRLPTEVALPKLASSAPLWRTGLGGAIYAPVAIRDDHAYVGTTGGAFYSLSLSDGRMEWIFIAGRPIHGGAVTTDDAVFFAADNGFLFRVARSTGKEVWRYDLGDARTDRVLGHPETEDFDWDVDAPTPILRDGVLYIGSSDGTFHAVNSSSGERAWRVETGAKIRPTALVTDSAVLFGNWNGDLLYVDRMTGTTRWKKAMRAPVTSTGVMIGGRIVLGTRAGVVYGLEPDSGKVQWRSAFWGSSVESDAEPLGGQFYIGSSDLRRISLIDATDGSVRWRTDVFGMPWARPVLRDGVLYVSVTGSKVGRVRHVGSLTAMDAATGRIIWAWRMPEWPGSLFAGFNASPTIAGDRLVVGGLDGSVYAFRLHGDRSKSRSRSR